MTEEKIFRSAVVTMTEGPDSSIFEAAKLMKAHNVGNIIIINKEHMPIGILTDRDIITRVVADSVDINTINVVDIMSRDLLILNRYQGLQEALDMMGAKGVRRAPIVDEHNKLIGIATLDDLLLMITEQINSLAKLMHKQSKNI